MVRDRPMVSSAKMMLMRSSFQKTNVPEKKLVLNTNSLKDSRSKGFLHPFKLF
jgi:hypothetical protein